MHFDVAKTLFRVVIGCTGVKMPFSYAIVISRF